MAKPSINDPARRRSRWSLLPPFPVFVTCFLVLTVIFFSITQHGRHLTSHLPLTKSRPHYQPGSHPQKHGGQLRETAAPRKSPWKELSKADIESVVKIVHARGHDAGVPKGSGIAFVERLMPNKTDAVPYLEHKSKKNIDGWARVVTTQPRAWGGEQGGISEWMVGPLPVTTETEVLPLSYIYTAGRNYIRRPVPNVEEILIWFNGIVTGPLRDIMSDLLGEVPDFTTMAKVPGLMAISSPDINTDEPKLAAWVTVFPPSNFGLRDAFSLLSQGLYAHVSMHGMEPKQWEITDWFYNGVLYNSTEEFHRSWESGALKKAITNPDGDWTDAEPTVEGMDGRELAAPMLIQPYGPRVEVDVKEKYVKWMGWEFYISFSQVTALGMHDIRFRGERIIYELGMQEAMAQYAGASPSSAGQLFFDTLFGFGLNTFELVPGYDCPTYATFLPISIYREGKTIKTKNAICVFEAVSDHPLQRHTTGQKVTVSRNSYLVVRAVSTIGNYDYTVSYIFYLDGAVEVKVHASGYIFSDYLAIDTIRRDVATSGETQQFEYGYRVHDVVSSLMHTHELSFKADLDIAGTSNTLYRVSVEPTKRTYEWEPTVERNTMHLVHTPVTHETGLDWPRNSQSIYVVLNNDSTNAWGEKRGYKIVPGTGMGTPPHLATENSTAAGRAAAWAEHDVWVIRQHDTEPRGASEWNAWEIADPLIDFGRMVDDESTVQEDLVIYFNLGVHHISNSADIPNTLMHWSGTSIMFVPHNFHDRDPSRESAQGVRMKLGKTGVEEVTYFGARYHKDVFLRKEDLDPDLSKYSPPRNGIEALAWNMTT